MWPVPRGIRPVFGNPGMRPGMRMPQGPPGLGPPRPPMHGGMRPVGPLGPFPGPASGPQSMMEPIIPSEQYKVCLFNYYY